ncbi:hypothetical protein Rsub_01696 [Raphidocelis subcapitata]|uniref:Hint domain-containing protein n=1 Tax=Raphidocelis subcapitata TaxID=307507 RepID=A0A2V0NVE9_9CHLO|nr:hypothetical protein Rsub_01696 [Raphidocelis subcapitata]|eukprot:GBF88795.1 hypothetical protein Rsub_01696 [Raphidocelis subcapitata]
MNRESWSPSCLLAVFLALLLSAPTARAAMGAGECLSRLADAADSCSSSLNDAIKIAYGRLDKLLATRGSSAFRADEQRFFALAVGYSQSAVKPPGSCCSAAAAVFAKQFQSECACLDDVSRHTRFIDRELFDFFYLFLKSSCGYTDDAATKWSSCGVTEAGFVERAASSVFSAKETLLGEGGPGAVASSAAASAAASLGRRLKWVDFSPVEEWAKRTIDDKGGLLASAPAPAPQCSARDGATPVAQNTASAPFYFLCPASAGTCVDGQCAFGRTAAVGKGEWASCAPLSNCGGGKGAADGGSGCFPARATVQLPGGRTKRMEELRVGDRVLALASDGTLKYEDVYFFGHRDAASDAAFVRLGLDGGAALELTPDHFVPVLRAGAAAPASGGVAEAMRGARMTYARDVKPGDTLLVTAGPGALRAAAVRSASAVARRGLFNPYTLGGTIVVDGVLASAHSGWLVDGAAAALGASHALPAFFQGLFAPLRLLYAAVGPEAMQAFGDALASAALRLEAALLARPLAPASAAPTAAAALAAALGGAAAVLKRRRAAQHSA